MQWKTLAFYGEGDIEWLKVWKVVCQVLVFKLSAEILQWNGLI